MDSQTPRRRGFLHRYFAFIERRGLSDRLLFHGVLIAVLASLIWFVVAINNTYLTSVPTTGGTLVEGIVGTPRFVNPVLAISRVDQDMVSLVYSGLVKLNAEGELVPDAAERITISEDGRTYNIKLRENLTFHNGMPLTVRDVAYTIALIQNPELKSPLQGNWDGVLVEELGDYEMNITIEEAYTPFLENLTVGILPRQLWDELPTEQMPFSQNNTEPVGSGPYRIIDVLRTESGLIKGYRLEAFSDYGNTPNITTLVFNFYHNETDLIAALNDGEIAGTASLSSDNAAAVNLNRFAVIEQPLPRIFAVYFNQNKSTSLRDQPVREALDIMVDRDTLVTTVLNGFGTTTNTPIPPGFIDLPNLSTTSATNTPETFDRLTRAESLLTAGGWSKNDAGTWVKEVDDGEQTLRISLATANTPLFEAISNQVAEDWRRLGIEVEVSQYEQADLVQGVIRPRNFEALLFGAEIGRSVDLYPFWHSSQKDDPGLNISQYTNIDVDALLTRNRTATSAENYNRDLARVSNIITADTPAVFLFTPTFRYFYDPDVRVQPLSRMSSQSDRFANINTWHIRANRVWPIFENDIEPQTN